MELHIKERLLIPTIFPEKNNFREFNLKKSIVSKVAITKQDIKDYDIVEKSDEQRVEWNIEKDIATPLHVEFNNDELQYLKKVCESISDQQMPDEMWAIVERIYDETQQ